MTLKLKLQALKRDTIFFFHQLEKLWTFKIVFFKLQMCFFLFRFFFFLIHASGFVS